MDATLVLPIQPVLSAEYDVPFAHLSGMWPHPFPGWEPPASAPGPLPFTLLVAAAAIMFSALLLLFFAQVALVAIGRTGLHRGIGIAGAGIAGTFIVAAYVMAVENLRRGVDFSGDIRLLPSFTGVTAEVFISIVVLLTFGILFGAALRLRTTPRSTRP